MKLFWCCFAAVLFNLTSAAVDVEKTVQHVQSILKSNALLPRLTREEIIQLLNDIRAEDAKSKSTTKVKTGATKGNTAKTIDKKAETTTPIYKSIEDNEINTATQPTKKLSDVATIENDIAVSASVYTKVESTTKSSGATLTVVLPYTPRDGSSLQELYTKPPRVQVVSENVIPKPTKTVKTKQENTKPTKKKATNTINNFDLDLPAELQAFLDSHGLKGKPGQDNFLLPLEGFKPLPPPRIVDGNVQLPENLLLTYDLISPSDLSTSSSNNQKLAQSNFLYEPLRPQFPFELDTASSELEHSVLPLDLPKSRKPKAIPTTSTPNYEPIDYEAVKVIPLNQGPSPIEEEVIVGVDQNKRQTNETDEESTTTATTIEVTNVDTETKNTDITAPDAVAADSDTGPSIADLEDSFGGAAPSEPGDSELPPPKKNGFYWMVDWNSFLEVGDGDTKVNIRFEPKLGDPQMFLPVNVP